MTIPIEISEATGISDIGALTVKLHDESRAAGSPVPDLSPGDGIKLSAQDLGKQPVPLPEIASHGRPLWDVLRERRAVRSYKKEHIELKSLATMLKAAADGDSSYWPPEQHSAKIEFLVIAWRIEGLEPGIHIYHPDIRSLVLLGPAPDQETDGKALVLQSEFADASAIILITGELQAALKQHGAWGHRNLLVRAGAAGHRLWLSSLATGLSGTVFAGLLPRAAQRLAGLDGFYRAGLFAYAVGKSNDSINAPQVAQTQNSSRD